MQVLGFPGEYPGDPDCFAYFLLAACGWSGGG